MSKLKVNNLSCEKGYNLLFENLSFEINSGQAWKVSGPDGSGKTSLLNIIAGFISPFKGDLFINKKKIKVNQVTKRFKIGFSSQNSSIIDENLYTNVLLDYPKNENENRLFKEKIDFYCLFL